MSNKSTGQRQTSAVGPKRRFAYENLLKSRRQVPHRRIAESLRDRFADKAAAEPEVLAHHFTQAGLTDAASSQQARGCSGHSRP
jgi:predicted ATPase